MLLIIGAESTIGNALYNSFQNSGDNVIGTSRNPNNDKFLHLDITNINTPLPFNNIKSVVICAGIGNIEYCKSNVEHSHLVNVSSVLRIIDFYKKKGVYVIFLSSTAVFDGKSAFALVEDLRNPVSIYGFQKKIVEDELIFNGLTNVAILRLAKVVTNSTKFIDEWNNSYSTNGFIEAYDNWFISPISLETVVEAMRIMIFNQLSGVYQLSSNYEISYYEFARSYYREHKNIVSSIYPTSFEGEPRHNSMLNSSVFRMLDKKIEEFVYNVKDVR